MKIDIQRWLNLVSGDESISFDWIGSPSVNAFAYCDPQKTFGCIGIGIGAYLRMNLVFYSLLAYTDIFDRRFHIGKRDKNCNHEVHLPSIIAMSYDDLQKNIPMVFSDRWWVASILEDRMTEFLLTHELAHIVLGHTSRVQNNRLGKMWSSLQQQEISLEERWVMELNADRLATDIIFANHFLRRGFLGERSWLTVNALNPKRRDNFLFCFLTVTELLMHIIHIQRKELWSHHKPHPISGYPTPWIRYQIVLNRSFFWMQTLFGLKADYVLTHVFVPMWSQLRSIRKAFHMTDDENFLNTRPFDMNPDVIFDFEHKVQKYAPLWKEHPLYKRLLRMLDFSRF